MQVSLIQSPNDIRHWNLGRLEAATTSGVLDEMALAHHGLWDDRINSYLTGHYDHATMRYRGKNSFIQRPQIGTDRWHLARSSSNPSDEMVVRIGLAVQCGIGMMFLRNARVLVSGTEDRECYVHHLWRTGDVDEVRLSGDAQSMLPPSARITVTTLKPHAYQVDIGDDWAFVHYRGPILPHPEELFSFHLLPGGVAFVIAPSGDSLIPAPDLGAGVSVHEAFPRILDPARLLDPHAMTFFRRSMLGAWALRLRLVHSELAWPYELENALPIRRQSDNGKILGQQNLAFWLQALRRLCPECGPLATFSPHFNFHPVLAGSSEWPPEFARGFDQSFSFFASIMTSDLHGGAVPADLRFTMTSPDCLTGMFGDRPVYFLPFKRPEDRVLLFVDSRTFFYLEIDPTHKLTRPFGLPVQFGVGMIGFNQPEEFAKRIERGVSRATDRFSMLTNMATIFRTHSPSPTQSCMVWSMRPPHPRGGPDDDPMDLVDQSL